MALCNRRRNSSHMTTPSKRLLLFTGKLGYQTRSFEESALKLGVSSYTSRIAAINWKILGRPRHRSAFRKSGVCRVHRDGVFSRPEWDGVLALGDRRRCCRLCRARAPESRTTIPPRSKLARNKLRMREIFRDAGLRVPWFSKLSHPSHARAFTAGHFVSLCVETSLAFRQPRCDASKQSQGISHCSRARPPIARVSGNSLQPAS